MCDRGVAVCDGGMGMCDGGVCVCDGSLGVSVEDCSAMFKNLAFLEQMLA